MRKYNVIVVIGRGFDTILMCKRRKEPYKGLLNLVGGKIETGEESLSAAYRELYEETGISSSDIELHHLIDFTYYTEDNFLESYAGMLKRDVEPYGDENELCWVDIHSNFFDSGVFAGMGNIGHMLNQIIKHRELF